MVVPWRYRRTRLVPDSWDTESSDTGFSSIAGNPPTPVKEPAQPGDFLCPPGSEGGVVDAGGVEQSLPWEEDGRPEVDLGEAAVDMGEAGGRCVWQETEQSRLLPSNSPPDEDLRRSSGGSQLDSEEESRLLLPPAACPEEDHGSGSSQPEPDGGGRLLPPDCSSDEVPQCGEMTEDIPEGFRHPQISSLVTPVPSDRPPGLAAGADPTPVVVRI